MCVCVSVFWVSESAYFRVCFHEKLYDDYLWFAGNTVSIHLLWCFSRMVDFIGYVHFSLTIKSGFESGSSQN